MAYLSFPTIGLIDIFFNANSRLFRIKSSSTLKSFKGTIPNIIADGFHFEPNYFSAPTLNGNELWGIDIPVLLQKDKNKKADNLLIIIGQDPLRKNTDTYLNFLFNNSIPPKQISIQNHTIIGTPYAVAAYNACQSKGTNNQYPKSQIYYDLFDAILTNKDYDYDIYLTDVRKYYPNINNCQIRNKDILLLISELTFLSNFYANIKILLSGNKAKNAWGKVQKQIGSQTVTVQTPHLSGTANGAWKKFLNNTNNTFLSNQSLKINCKKILYILANL